VSLFLRFGRLGQNSLWKEEILAEFRQHLKHMGIVLIDQLVEFFGQGIHERASALPCSMK
jgi:hypothetical protein